MDATQLFRERIQSLLIRGLASDDVTRVLGVEGVSEVWDGAVPVDRPAWYFWLRAAPGAYKLRLEEASRSAGECAATGRFAIHYYPARGEASFASFAFEERAFVERGFLDATGTPSVERAHEIPDDLFAIGVLEYRLDDHGEPVEIAFASMNRLRVRYDEETALRYEPLGTEVRHSRGELARDVPGWRLGTELFRCIAGLEAHHSRRVPCSLAVERHAGTEFVRRGGTFECLATDAVVLGEAVVRFAAAGDAAPGSSSTPPELPLDLGAEWWNLAEAPHRQDAPCCGCGCGDREPANDAGRRHASAPKAHPGAHPAPGRATARPREAARETGR